MKRLAICCALGALLLAGRRMLATRRAEAVVVEVAADADPVTVERAVIDAVLVDQALRQPWTLRDPVLRGFLVAAMRAVDPDAAADALVTRALALGMARTDPATRARLAFLARQTLRARVRTARPNAAELAVYVAAHADRYARPWLALRQRTISRARHGAAAEADARALASALAADPAAPGGDPSLLPARIAGTAQSIDARFGPGFAAGVAGAPSGRWAGPYPSSFGYHVVWREPAGRPPDDKLLDDWQHDAVERELGAAINALVARRRVELRRLPR